MTQAKPKRSPEFSTRLLPDGYVLIYSDTVDNVYTLTPMGGVVWEFCDGQNTREEIADLVRSNAELGAVSSEIYALIDDLEKNGLLEPAVH